MSGGRHLGRTGALVAAALVAAAAALPLVAGDESAPPPRDDPAAQAMLARVRGQILGRPLVATADLNVRRGSVHRSLRIRLHLRDDVTSLARAEGPPREHGTTILRTGGRIHVWFPRADVVLELPPGFGGDRLFGSDFSIDDLLAPGGDPARFLAALGPEESVAGTACRRVDLHPRTQRDSLAGRTSVWLELSTLVPRRVEVFSDRGERLRVVETEGAAPDGLPPIWRARTVGPRGGTSELRFVFVERDPPVDPQSFTVEALRTWR